MRVIVLVIIVMISFSGLVQTKIDSIKIYTLNFQLDTRYGYGINDVIEHGELTTLLPLQLKVNDSLIDYISSLDLSPYSGGINLRMVCIIHSNLGKKILGFSNTRIMQIAEITYTERDDNLLAFFANLIDNAKYREIIFDNIKSLKNKKKKH
jgi:hypothetical protein